MEIKKSATEYANNLQSNLNLPIQNENLAKNENATTQKEADIKESASKVDAKELMMQYTVQFQMSVSGNFLAQSGLNSGFGNFGNGENYANNLQKLFSSLDLSAIGYEGKPLRELSSDEAKELVGENGFFGITQTSDRIADFVIAGAREDIEKLKAGREGIIIGYEQAQKAWGDELPEISKKTLDRALEKIDKTLADLGVNVLEQDA
ncbi:hydrogenase-4 component G [Helicobacter burdigaliensis]|uniref:hydrogenase-4 component G n=1 Tax=Helicobacter burdigaliensis TaxID=2315334 RepID=UPI001E5F6FF6|nr:hydrogenase-4 component G [Helicobacter burdigaliensis]